ncbi:MAG TPA: hypothetical protein VMA30_09535 [Xanthobacteraceae bacterium]|nr:hypothetical protein [Xanthobacteraceae bacterium]
MTRPFAALALVAALFATCARAQDLEQPRGQPEMPPPVGGVVSPENAMIFYAAHGGEEACGANCSDWIAAEGTVQWDTYKRLFAFLDRFGARKTLVLNVWGTGDVKAAMSLGRIIRERKLDTSAGATVVAGCAKLADADCFALKRGGAPLDARLDINSVECDLICVLVLAGGVHRSLPVDARVVIGGMEMRNRVAPNLTQESSRGLRSYYDDQLGLYLAQMGVNPQIVDIIDHDSKIHRATPLSNNDWLRLGLVTGLAL